MPCCIQPCVKGETIESYIRGRAYCVTFDPSQVKASPKWDITKAAPPPVTVSEAANIAVAEIKNAKLSPSDWWLSRVIVEQSLPNQWFYQVEFLSNYRNENGRADSLKMVVLMDGTAPKLEIQKQ